WQALEQDLTDLFTYQTTQNENDNSKNKSQLENGHSLWLPAKQNVKNSKLFIGDLLDNLTDKVLSLSALITVQNLALCHYCYLYTVQPEINTQQMLEYLIDVMIYVSSLAI